MAEIYEQGAYSFVEAANYLRMPLSTLRAWCVGQSAGKKRFRHVIQLPPGEPKSLSFMNLVELHVLDAIRRKHDVPLQTVRKSLDFLRKHFPSKHPLADQEFETDGVNLFVEKFGSFINLSKEGQTEIKEALRVYLSRIERDKAGVPIRLYPFTRAKKASDPRSIVIDPRISFGRPVISGTGVPTASIVGRFKAGDTIPALAEEFGISSSNVEEAIRCEHPAEAA